MLSTSYISTIRFFAHLDTIVQSSLKSAYEAEELEWDKSGVSNPAIAIYSLFHSEEFTAAVNENLTLNTIESEFIVEGLLNSQLSFELEGNTDYESTSASMRIQYWIEQISIRGYAGIFTPSITNFPVDSPEIFTNFLIKELHRFSNTVDVYDDLTKSYTIEKILKCYREIGLDTSLVQQKSILNTEDNQIGGKVYCWSENSKLCMHFIYTRENDLSQLTASQAYIILHELGHLTHKYFIHKAPVMFHYIMPELWSEALADAFVLIAADMLSNREDAETILLFLNGQRYFRIEDALTLIQSNSINRDQEDITNCFNNAANDLNSMVYTLSLPLSIVVADHIFSLYKTNGIEYIRNLLTNTHGNELNNYINSVIKEHLTYNSI